MARALADTARARASSGRSPISRALASASTPDLEERSTVLTEAPAVHQGRTRGRIVEAENHAGRRRLAGAVRSEELGYKAGMNLEAKIVDSDGLAEALGQSSDLDVGELVAIAVIISGLLFATTRRRGVDRSGACAGSGRRI